MAEQEQNLRRVVQMPEAEELLQRLPAGTLGLTPEADAFYRRFAESIGGSEKFGAGLNMAWELAGYDTLRSSLPIVRVLVNMHFDKVIDAITPDPEVAEQAKEFRRKVLEEVEREKKAQEPKIEDLGLADSLSDFERYSQVRRVGDVLVEHDNGRHDDRRRDGVNPFYNQTHRGVYLEQYYGSPSKLWTPWGKFNVLGSGWSWAEKDVDAVLKQLGATLHKPVVNNEMGTIGPIYAVHNVDSAVLPNPVERPRSQFVPCEEVTEAWKSLTQQYRQSKHT